MKKIMIVLMFAIVATYSAEAGRYRPGFVSISFQTFYDELSPYGDWIYTPDYGYVWHPYFDRPEDFRPYSSNGDWVYTEYGWTWVSDYRWGWAPFHYGRWFFDDYLGWMWIPGNEWAPAWVTWGSYNSYWGWAPLGPNVYVSVDFNWRAPDFWWTFIPYRHFNSHSWRNYIYDRPVRITNITYITNVYTSRDNRQHNPWFNGPRVNDVERYGRTRVRRMDVIDTDRSDNLRAENGRLNVYRPAVEERRDTYRPAESRNMENARPVNRISQQNPRSNDPGLSRTRENRIDNSDSRQTAPGRQTVDPKPQPKRENPANDRNRSIENRNENRSNGNRENDVKSGDKPRNDNGTKRSNRRKEDLSDARPTGVQFAETRPVRSSEQRMSAQNTTTSSRRVDISSGNSVNRSSNNEKSGWNKENNSSVKPASDNRTTGTATQTNRRR